MTDKIQDRLLKASRYEVRKEAADYIDKLEAVVEKVANVEDIEVMLSTRDLAILCNAAVVKGQSLQDFVFLAAWDAAGLILNEEPEK
jgi:hypothetical protein